LKGQNETMSEQGKQAVRTAEAPAAIGPYSQAVVVGGLVYTSGQVGFDPKTGELVVGGIEEQTRQVLQNLSAVLIAAGSGLGKVLKTTVFLKDMNDFAAMNAVYARYLVPEGAVPPARSTVEVARLPRDARVEIEAIALIDGSTAVL
jgi:2-iminobutanoate/2-iminopropanoate deaminase